MEEDGDAVIKDEFQAWRKEHPHGRNPVNLEKVNSCNQIKC